jgi:hypothetical protein
LLTPGVPASVGMSDVYYRWSKFSRPTRHLKVVRQGEGPLTLLTAFGPQVPPVQEKNVYQFRVGDVSCTVLVGEGTSSALSSDGHFAIAAEDHGKGRVEMMRFGGSRLAYGRTAAESSAEDVFAAVANGRVARLVESGR